MVVMVTTQGNHMLDHAWLSWLPLKIMHLNFSLTLLRMFSRPFSKAQSHRPLCPWTKHRTPTLDDVSSVQAKVWKVRTMTAKNIESMLGKVYIFENIFSFCLFTLNSIVQHIMELAQNIRSGCNSCWSTIHCWGVVLKPEPTGLGTRLI